MSDQCGEHRIHGLNEVDTQRLACPDCEHIRLSDRIDELEMDNDELQATIERVREEVAQIDRAFNHPDTTSHEAYRNIRAMIGCLNEALGDKV